MEDMTIDYAIRLLQKETSATEISKLEYYAGFNKEKVIDKIDEAIDLLCDIARKYQHLEEGLDHESN